MPLALPLAEQQWRIEVMTMYGPWCYLHHARDPRSRIRATVMLHVIDPALTVPSLAYATFRTGRPVCAACAAGNAAGDPMCRWPYEDALDATRAHNEEAAKNKVLRYKYRLPLPEPHRSAWDPAPWENAPTPRCKTYTQPPRVSAKRRSKYGTVAAKAAKAARAAEEAP